MSWSVLRRSALLKARMALLLLTPTVRAIAANGIWRSRSATICSSRLAMSTRAYGVRVSPPRVLFEGSNGAWSMAVLGSHADQAPMTSARPLFNFVEVSFDPSTSKCVPVEAGGAGTISDGLRSFGGISGDDTKIGCTSRRRTHSWTAVFDGAGCQNSGVAREALTLMTRTTGPTSP